MLGNFFQKILVAYNGSKSSLNAVLYGIIMAKTYKCSLKIVFVVDTASIKKLSLSKFLVADEAITLSSQLEQDGKKNLEYVQELASKKGIKIEKEVLHGEIWSEIVHSATSWKADLILLGAGEEPHSSYSIHPTISKQDSEIIGSAHCSVLVVRDEYINQKFRLL